MQVGQLHLIQRPSSYFQERRVRRQCVPLRWKRGCGKHSLGAPLCTPGHSNCSPHAAMEGSTQTCRNSFSALKSFSARSPKRCLRAHLIWLPLCSLKHTLNDKCGILMKTLHSETEPLALQMQRGGTRPEKDEGHA